MASTYRGLPILSRQLTISAINVTSRVVLHRVLCCPVSVKLIVLVARVSQIALSWKHDGADLMGHVD